jgi:hypothetical protein
MGTYAGGMFVATEGTYTATTGGKFVATELSMPDELRVVVPLASSASASLHVRVLTKGVANDVHSYNNAALLATKVAVTVGDGQGAVLATLVEVKSVGIYSGTYMAYKVTLPRAVIPSEILYVSVLAPYVGGTMATTAPDALLMESPVVEIETTPGLVVPAWAPTAASGVGSPGLPAPHKLVSSKPVDVSFTFAAPESFDLGAVASFSATVNGAALSLASATVSDKSLVVPVTASAAIDHRFVFVAFGRIFVFVVASAAVFAFPSIAATARSVPVVTLGNPLGITSTFSADLPAAITASVVVTPTGGSPATYAGIVAGPTVAITHTVQHDTVHAGAVTLTYGSTSSVYSWASGTLTNAHIYTFPSAFTYSGLANAYLGGAHLKAETSGTLVLTFSGGDMLFSSVLASQVSYVKYTQGSTQTTVTGAACSDPLETVTFALTPAVRQALTLHVLLQGPDGTLGAELTATVPIDEFESQPNAVATTAGLRLWLDGSDPLGTGTAPSDGAAVATWADKSGYNRHAVRQYPAAHSSTFRAGAKNGKGAMVFYTDTWRNNIAGATTNVQRYLSPLAPFPSAAYTIFAVFRGEIGQVLSGSGAFNVGLGIAYAGLMTAAQSGAPPAWGANPGWDTNKKFNILSQWTLATMVVSGSSCTPHVNGVQMSDVPGPTTAFDGVVVGGWSSLTGATGDYFIGDLGELAIYAGALDPASVVQVHRALGQKWGLWPYNLSPLWNVVEDASGAGFGAQFGAFVGGGGNWGSSVYWEWFQSQFDLTLLDQSDSQYQTLPGVHINMHSPAPSAPYGSVSYVLNNPMAGVFYTDVRPATNAEWAIRWGYQAGQRPTHVALRTGAGSSPSAAVYQVTGFASSAFTSGTLLATLDGTRCGTSAYVWTALTVVGRYTHFELRQVTGPFDAGVGRGILLGRSSTADTSGCGSVARSNLKCWLDGSDPHATGEAPVDGTVVVKMNDKSGTGRYGYPFSTLASENSLQFCSASSTSTSSGATRMPRQWGLGGFPAGYMPQMRINFPHTSWPAAYTVCIAARFSRTVGTGNWWLVWDGDPMFQIAVYNNTLQFTNNATLNPLSQMNTKKADGSYVVPNAGEWAFLCLVSTSASSIPYYNGTRLPSINTAPSVDAGRTWVQLFGRNGDYLSHGDLGEFAFYDRALTDNEISTLRGTLATKLGVTLAPI